MSDHQPAVIVKDLYKSFKLPHEQHNSIKQMIVNITKREKGYETQHVLDDVSFEIKKGEFFGIVGRNGSGKSTLLKLLAGIYTPDKGLVRVNGSLTPFIELGVGFNPELTGRENVFLNGALLGFGRKEMEAMYDDIIEFAELERFMDQKLKNYSSGMQVRLAFSIAIRANTAILLIDEVLAVGDASFQQKCYHYFNELKRKGKTVILVTHDMAAVKQFCTKAIFINQGRVEAVGTPNKIARLYEESNLSQSEKALQRDNAKKHNIKHQGNGSALVESVESYDCATDKPKYTFMADERIGIRIKFIAQENILNPAAGFILQDAQRNTLFATNNIINDSKIPQVKKGQRLELLTEFDNVFTNGEYTLSCSIENKDERIIYDRIEDIITIVLGGHNLPHAFTHPEHHFSFTINLEDKKT